MDANTCKVALEVAATVMTAKQLAKFQTVLRKRYLSSEIERVTLLLARPKQPVQEYKALVTSLPILQQQLASIQ